MNAPVTYHPAFVDGPDEALAALQREIAWGKEKLIEYLIKLSKAAGIRVKDRGT
jgi:hypothetical protein